MSDRNDKISLNEQVIHCEENGGTLAIVYNDGYFYASVGKETTVTIPVFRVDKQVGQAIVGYDSSIVRFLFGYTYMSGTSMATPHVAAAITGLWKECQQCRNHDILSCIKTTSRPLGHTKKSLEFGFGMIRMKKAFKCLRKVRKCCFV